MSTLYQLHASINTLKPITKDMALLWQAGDSMLLLGETAAYVDWLSAYIDDLNHDDETDHQIDAIHIVYVLQEDVDTLNNSAKAALDFTAPKAFTLKIISDAQWVTLTHEVDKVVTLTTTI